MTYKGSYSALLTLPETTFKAYREVIKGEKKIIRNKSEVTSKVFKSSIVCLLVDAKTSG